MREAPVFQVLSPKTAVQSQANPQGFLKKCGSAEAGFVAAAFSSLPLIVSNQFDRLTDHWKEQGWSEQTRYYERGSSRYSTPKKLRRTALIPHVADLGMAKGSAQFFQKLRGYQPGESSLAEINLIPVGSVHLDLSKSRCWESQIPTSDQVMCQAFPGWVVSHQHQGLDTVFLLPDELDNGSGSSPVQLAHRNDFTRPVSTLLRNLGCISGSSG